MEAFKASLAFESIGPDQAIDLGEAQLLRTFALEHPGGSLAYRIDCGSCSLIYATDTEQMQGEKRENFLKFAAEVDLLILDTNFTEAEYEGGQSSRSKRERGHSSWEEGMKLAEEAAVGRLIFFHHKEDWTDLELALMEDKAKRKLPNSAAARERMVIRIRGDQAEKVVIDYP